MSDFIDLLSSEKVIIDEFIKKELKRKKPAFYPQLYQAMEYSLFSGGKRIRPILLMWCAKLGKDKLSDANISPILNKAVAAIEYIHTYSLIHDDLPSMDNDDIRRGKPTSHKKFGEAVAILAGDALLTEAFALLGETNISKLTVVLAENAGAAGMVAGQVADIERGTLSIDYINNLKTAKLFRCATVMGGICGGVEDSVLEKLADYGINLGRAFQLRDDILDNETENSDLTYKKASDFINKAINSIIDIDSGMSDVIENLTKLAKFVIKRNV